MLRAEARRDLLGDERRVARPVLPEGGGGRVWNRVILRHHILHLLLNHWLRLTGLHGYRLFQLYLFGKNNVHTPPFILPVYII